MSAHPTAKHPTAVQVRAMLGEASDDELHVILSTMSAFDSVETLLRALPPLGARIVLVRLAQMHPEWFDEAAS